MKTEKDIDFFFCKMKQNHVPTHCNNRLTSSPTRPSSRSAFPSYYPTCITFQSLFISSICKQYRGLIPSRCCTNYSYTSQESIDRVSLSLSFLVSLCLASQCIISSEAHLDGHVLHAPDTTSTVLFRHRPYFSPFCLEILLSFSRFHFS